jgi:hypothetical protein
MRRGLAVPAGLGLVLLAFGVGLSVPDDAVVEAPFATTGRIGEELVSQHLVVTVHDAALAQVVELNGWEGTTAGVWLVVDATIAARVDRRLVASDVFVGAARYPGTGRASTDTVDGRVADAGFPVTGSILVELPADVRERPGATSARLRLSSGYDVRLDSVVELTLDLTRLELHERLELERPRAGER